MALFAVFCYCIRRVVWVPFDWMIKWKEGRNGETRMLVVSVDSVDVDWLLLF